MLINNRQRRGIVIARTASVLLGLSLGIASNAWADPSLGNGWPMAGQDLHNTRSQPAQTSLNAGNASRLVLKWSTSVHGDVSATPAVVGGAVYVPDWGGYLSKLDAATGKLLWERRINSYAGEPQAAISRTSPAVVGDTVFIGDQSGAHVLAVNATTGDLIWSTSINPSPVAIVTQSPVVNAGVVYVGASSSEEAAALSPDYPCCSFRGSFSAIDAKTGKIKWTTYTVPENNGKPGGYSGGAVWGSTAAIDIPSKTVFVTTGNNYTVPQSATDCQAAGGTMSQCLAPDDHIDAVLALDMDTGRIKWNTGVQGFDAWNVACLNIPGGSPQNCPPLAGPDFDFGSGANLLTVKDGAGKPQLLVGAGQKRGVYWLLDAQTGAIRSSTVVGPGSSLGGIEWGSATDNTRIYVANSDNYRIPYTVNGKTVTVGSFAAIDPSSGKILWQLVDPSGSALDIGPMTVTNGVAFASSMSGHMYALNAATGDVLWDYTGQGSSNAGPAIDESGTVYWGNGYANLGLGSQSFTFYAFSVDGK